MKQSSVLGLYAVSAFLPKEVARLDVVIEKMQMSEGEQHGYFRLRQKKKRLNKENADGRRRGRAADK